jgi:xanthine dehydrogenase YagR molybdenum-binding subunit
VTARTNPSPRPGRRGRRSPRERAAGARIALSGAVVRVVRWAARYLPDRPTDPLIHERTHVGRSLPRLDARAKVTGEARFSAEVAVDGLAHAALVHSSVARGTITGIDTAAAERADGVLAVLSHATAPPMADPPVPPPASSGLRPRGTAASDLPVLGRHVRWNGQPVAVVVAETLDQAQHACSLVRVTYDAEAAALSFDAAAEHDAIAPVDVVGEDARIAVGDAEDRLARAEAAWTRRVSEADEAADRRDEAARDERSPPGD